MKTRGNSQRQFGRTRKRPAARPGVAAVEFAVCLPVLLIFILGTIECTNMVFVQQSIHVVAYEGVRAAIDPNASSSAVVARCNEVISERGLHNVTVTTVPSDVTTLSRGLPITLRVECPYADNCVTGMNYSFDHLTAEVVMVKE